jgi:hypothetical protein
MSQNNKEHRIHKRENCPYQVSKPCVKLIDGRVTAQNEDTYTGICIKF